MAQPPARPTVAMPPKPSGRTVGRPTLSTGAKSGTLRGNTAASISLAEKQELAQRHAQYLETRKKCLQDIYNYQDGICKQLELTVMGFLQPMAAAAETDTLPGISKIWIRQTFLNMEQILQINKQVLDMLHSRLASWSDVPKIADIFGKMVQSFKFYVSYGGNYNRAQEVFVRCLQDGHYQTFLERLEKQNNIGLELLLVIPLQVVAGYVPLLQEYLAKTEQGHSDLTDLPTAMGPYEQLAEWMLKNANTSIDAKARSKALPTQRKLIAEGVFMIKEHSDKDNTGIKKLAAFASKTGKDARLQLWLFSDVLVHIVTRHKARPTATTSELNWPLCLVWIKDNPEVDQSDPKLPFTFTLIGPKKVYTVRFPELAEKNTWFARIRDAVNNNLTEENSSEELNRCGRYVFPDKECGAYEGWWTLGKIHGEGVYKFCGNTYTGDWEYNTKSGIGTMEMVTGEVFHGEWKDDVPNGYGQLQYNNRDRYDGEWKNGMRSGKGVHYYNNGDKYDGEWLNNVPHGEGAYTTMAGHMYVGGWKHGRLHGYGLLMTPNGRRYEGMFKDGQRSGEGKLEYNNGDFYLGQWLGDKRHGYGIYHSATEGVYEGYWVTDQKEGQGTMHYLNGDVYDGQWKRGYYSGTGTLFCASGGMERYEGSWDNGMQNGKGILYYRSGARHEGHFKDDKVHGHGIFISENAVTFEGKWEDGVREGKATLAVGPSKFASTVTKNLMGEGKQNGNFMVIPDVPVFYFDL